MRQRLETLHRLVNLYTAVEEMHAAELQHLTAAVHEVQRAIAIEHKSALIAREDGRQALANGDLTGRVMAETQMETAAWRQKRLGVLRLKREELNNAAREQYVASRLKREQMSRVRDDIAESLQEEKERRGQAASDDRFLARRRWSDARDRLRSSDR